ncbi:hypothetical protein CHARACLAT_015282 [Characodon lateralis]|uniref:Uncharacterized protein n=1 Tax=Characodon lateralis TaxID=208331 RepID=A0ABU7F3L2_9TELE|nr:hypothetical protein [Characodon lateralis]
MLEILNCNCFCKQLFGRRLQDDNWFNPSLASSLEVFLKNYPSSHHLPIIRDKWNPNILLPTTTLQLILVIPMCPSPEGLLPVGCALETST